LLLNYHIDCCILGSLCAGDLVWMGLSGVLVAGCSTTALYVTRISFSEGVFLFLAEKYRGFLSVTVLSISTFHVLRTPFDVPKYVVFVTNTACCETRDVLKQLDSFVRSLDFLKSSVSFT